MIQFLLHSLPFCAASKEKLLADLKFAITNPKTKAIWCFGANELIKNLLEIKGEVS